MLYWDRNSHIIKLINVFGIFTELCHYHHNFRTLLSVQKETSITLALTLLHYLTSLSPHQPLKTTNLFSVSVDLHILDTSYKGYPHYVVFCDCLLSLCTMLARIIHAVLHSFLWLSAVPFQYEYITLYSFI